MYEEVLVLLRVFNGGSRKDAGAKVFREIGELDLTVYPADFVEAFLVGQIAAQVRVQ